MPGLPTFLPEFFGGSGGEEEKGEKPLGLEDIPPTHANIQQYNSRARFLVGIGLQRGSYTSKSKFIQQPTRANLVPIRTRTKLYGR